MGKHGKYAPGSRISEYFCRVKIFETKPDYVNLKDEIVS